MTFRTAALIHKRRPQSRRRIIPGVALAAALVAAVLFLATTTNIQAAAPVEEEAGITACQGMSGGSLDITNSIVSGESHSVDNACQVGVTVTPPAQGVSACQVSYTPAVSASGIALALAATGDCEGVELETTIDLGPQMSSGSGNSATRSKVTAWHYGTGAVPGIKLFWHYAKVTWSHTLTRVFNGSLTTDYWEGGCDWELTSESRRIVEGSNRYLGEHNTKWYADCGPLPDANAESQAGVIARPGGARTCYGSATFSGGLAGFRYTHDCLDH
jgi:hypothetical protein